MANSLRHEVLKAFKSLHKARLNVFKDDNIALEAARKKINEEFVKNKHVTDEGAIKEMLKFTSEVEQELKTHVIQAREVRPGEYAVRITPDTEKLTNIPFTEMPDEILARGKNVPCSKSK
uniref:Complex III assembly factor LYRM7 n=1 Tax=Clastoptera arizonana TaxID=38151 RepID=A0A1B6C4T0_9HEMI